MHAISEPFPRRAAQPGSPFPENLISPRYESELIHEAEIIARRVALFAVVRFFTRARANRRRGGSEPRSFRIEHLKKKRTQAGESTQTTPGR